ncbi:hypothetical protein [Desulfosporosinus lacus]|uniref:Uncharacterized protein n=1 Tax=Desulfosporosinus lacus DSM 15449 TaxID=1121420 RepID=A0A1M5Z7R4_9FIRM|nr:hypothetical protein [Desulfosporosinus lacus]SHI20270.1 hypothetical protein SAMN02746098_03072 [Desulfosporosinus lacus DSM 15449]
MNFEQIYYANSQHKGHFLALLTQKKSNESGYYSAYYILTSTKEIWSATKRYTTLEEIDFGKILEQGFASNHRALILLAQHLFMGSTSFDLDHALESWDQISYSVALQAIKLRWTLSRESMEGFLE